MNCDAGGMGRQGRSRAQREWSADAEWEVPAGSVKLDVRVRALDHFQCTRPINSPILIIYSTTLSATRFSEWKLLRSPFHARSLALCRSTPRSHTANLALAPSCQYKF